MAVKSIFLDTNVVIDFLADRRPFSLDAARLFDMADRGDIKICISAISYNNIYYILRRSLTGNSSIKLLEELASITTIIDVTGEIIKDALKAGFRDYEDAIQYLCALNAPGIDCIVTRNAKDFKKGTMAILSPAEAVAAY